MAISWGAPAGHMQVGIDVRTDGYNADTTAINVYVDFWVQTVAYGFNDQQSLTVYINGGAWTSYSYRLSSPSGATVPLLLGTVTIAGQGLSYGGGPAYTFQGNVSGNDLGPNPSHAIGWTLPARPPNIPAAPPTRVDSVTASSARVVVSAADGRGAGVDAYNVRVQRASDGAILYDQVGSGTVTVGGLARTTGHVAFSRAHNAVGWGIWSAGQGFTTSATAPDAAAAAPRVTSAEPDTLALTWAAPVNGGSAITGYDLQASTTAAFTTAITTSTTTTSGTVTGLVPATAYFVRFRAKNAVGAGAWSPVLQTETLPSAKVRVADVWQRARVWVLAPSGWAQAKVWKRTPDGTWRL